MAVRISQAPVTGEGSASLPGAEHVASVVGRLSGYLMPEQKMRVYNENELGVLQRYVDGYQMLRGLQPLTGFGFDPVGLGNADERRTFLSLEDAGILNIDRRLQLYPRSQLPVIASEYAALSEQGAEEVDRLVGAGILKNNDL